MDQDPFRMDESDRINRAIRDRLQGARHDTAQDENVAVDVAKLAASHARLLGNRSLTRVSRKK